MSYSVDKHRRINGVLDLLFAKFPETLSRTKAIVRPLKISIHESRSDPRRER